MLVCQDKQSKQKLISFIDNIFLYIYNLKIVGLQRFSFLAKRANSKDFNGDTQLLIKTLTYTDPLVSFIRQQEFQYYIKTCFFFYLKMNVNGLN